MWYTHFWTKVTPLPGGPKKTLECSGVVRRHGVVPLRFTEQHIVDIAHALVVYRVGQKVRTIAGILMIVFYLYLVARRAALA